MIHNRKTMLVLLVVLLLASTALVAFMLQPTAAELLTQAIETMQGVTDGHAIVELQVTTPEQNANAEVALWGKLDVGPNGEPAFRVEVRQASKPEAVGLTAVSDGSQLWVWHPISNTVYTATAEDLSSLIAEKMAESDWVPEHSDDYADAEIPETAEEAVAQLLQYFTAERLGTEDVGEMAAHKVRLVPIPEEMAEEIRAAGGFINVWIGAENQAPLAIEYAESQVGMYAKAAATHLELNQGVDDERFNFEIPEGAIVVDLVELAEAKMAQEPVSLELETLSPGYLPADASLVGTSQVRGAIVQRYSLPGGDSFTVAQGPADINYQPEGVGAIVALRGTDATLYVDEGGKRSLLSWTENGISFWLGGDLTAEEAQKIAESLR